jgi:hypothetical protein
MMNKKRVAILTLVLLVLPLIVINLNLAKADSLPGTGIDTNQVENVTNQVNNVANQFGQPSKAWTYMGQELQKLILQNSVVRGIDSFLNKISFVFVIFFGVKYSMSVSLFFIIALWVYFFLTYCSIFKNFSSFSRWISRVVSLLLVVIMAQLKLFEKMINLVIYLLFGSKPWWVKALIAVGIAVVLFLLLWYIKKFGSQIKENRKKMKEAEARAKLELAAATGETFTKTVGKALSDVGEQEN